MNISCDYLIIGGGSAGCIIAKRLAEKTKGRIILLEAGKSDEGDPAALYLNRLDEQTGDYDWGYRASPLAGAPPLLDYARAKILGGCGNHNDCAFLRPPESDFAEWERLGATGWGPTGVAPFFERIDAVINIDREDRVAKNPVSRVFIEAGRELGLADVDFRAQIAPGVGWFPLNARGNFRQSSSIGYLHPLSKLPKNLEVWTECPAKRLLFDGRRCVGVETARGAIRAAREVILAAGSINTPQLMMLSGLGPAAHLKGHGIEIVADIPGVGQHLLDHVAAAVCWELKDPVPSWEVCPFEATMLLTLEDDQTEPDALFHFGLRVREKYGDHPRFKTDRPAVKASPNVARARSEGAVTLRSGDHRDAPVIDLNYFSDPEGYDARVLLKAMRFARRLGETRAMSAIKKREFSPGPGVETDDEWIAYIREVCETVYHPSGTCRIGGVVSPDLKVKGIDALRVCDASVFPSMVTVNINNTVMMVAEKAAEMVAAG
jgi:choline oxidase